MSDAEQPVEPARRDVAPNDAEPVWSDSAPNDVEPTADRPDPAPTDGAIVGAPDTDRADTDVASEDPAQTDGADSGAEPEPVDTERVGAESGDSEPAGDALESAAPDVELPPFTRVETVPSAEALARAERALDEITREGVGAPVDAWLETPEVMTLRFASTLSGYPDWHWTVIVSVRDHEDPSVLELGLFPGEGSLLAPPWVPWADRLAEYLAGQEAAKAQQQIDAAAADDDSSTASGDEDDETDEADVDYDGFDLEEDEDIDDEGDDDFDDDDDDDDFDDDDDDDDDGLSADDIDAFDDEDDDTP